MSSTKTDLHRASLIARIVFAMGAIVLVPGMGLTLRADPPVSDDPVATVETAPPKSADETLAQNAPAPEGKTAEGQDAKARLRAQQVVARRAEARYQSARLDREIAEIVIVDYEEGIFKQDLSTVEGKIKLAESDIARSEDRLDWARRMHKKGFVSKATVVSEELTLKKVRFALEQAQSKKKVLVDYTRGKTVKELKSAVEKARSDELAKKEAWDRERAKESALLEREVIRSAKKPFKLPTMNLERRGFTGW